MTKAVFNYHNGKFQNFEISGHSGYQDKGSDIVCSAISTAVFTSINLIDKIYGNQIYALNQNEKSGYIKFSINKPVSNQELLEQIVTNLYEMLSDIENDYATYLSIKKENIL